MKRTPTVLFALVALASLAAPAPADEPAAEVLTLFDFEDPADVQVFSNLELPAPAPLEPAARLAQSDENATSGRHSLKITYAGGAWPTLTTTRLPEDWMKYATFEADVTVERPSVVGFTVLQKSSQRDQSWAGSTGRWTKTEQLQAGRNHIRAPLHESNDHAINTKGGPVVRFEIFFYQPHDGESIWVDNIRLSTAKFVEPPAQTQFRVLGTDLVVSGVRELNQKLRDSWQPPQSQSLDQVEADLRGRYAELKKEHPAAVLAILRDGERGYDPRHPDAVYSGWKDAYWSSHGPDGMNVERAHNQGTSASHEIFMRHRSPLMRIDLASIPPGAKILAAQLVIVSRPRPPDGDRTPEKPNVWVAEACNRDWQETEVNAYQYATDKFWRAIGGMDWGDDADFLPLYLAYGPSQGAVNHWDFTAAVRYWTGGHPNHGFMLHGDSTDYIGGAHSREAEKIQDRPALWVMYDPPPQ